MAAHNQNEEQDFYGCLVYLILDGKTDEATALLTVRPPSDQLQALRNVTRDLDRELALTIAFANDLAHALASRLARGSAPNQTHILARNLAADLSPVRSAIVALTDALAGTAGLEHTIGIVQSLAVDLERIDDVVNPLISALDVEGAFIRSIAREMLQGLALTGNTVYVINAALQHLVSVETKNDTL